MTWQVPIEANCQMSANPVYIGYGDRDELAGAVAHYVSQAELKRATEFTVQRRRAEFLAGRGLVRALLETVTGKASRSRDIVTDANGKPRCIDGPAISIAHSDRLIVCAVALVGDIGVDVESAGRQRDSLKIAQRYFSEAESAWLAQDTERRFRMLWVLKEAWLKATGAGIGGGLDSVRFSVDAPRIHADIRDGSSAYFSLLGLNDALLGLAVTGATRATEQAYRWDKHAEGLVTDAGARHIACSRSASGPH
jgi:4'-phosphopantetheinyl transferase